MNSSTMLYAAKGSLHEYERVRLFAEAKKKSPQYIATKNAKFNGLNEKFLKKFLSPQYIYLENRQNVTVF